jgi:hypothetical protein
MQKIKSKLSFNGIYILLVETTTSFHLLLREDRDPMD